MFDLLIKNAKIVDGTGKDAVMGDVAVQDGKIAEVGQINGPAKRTIDADGHLLTPGFVDIHTHYDGQVCWDKQVTPSSWHGVTTVVMGNCGVGFAPVRPGKESDLVHLMESVEDIPEVVLDQGIPWGWESFSEYLDAIDTPYAIDVGAQAPHAAIRHYVMDDRCYDDATPEDMAAMATLTREAMEAGALGFSTSRFYGHVDRDGKQIPGTHASAKEMKAIVGELQGLDHGAIEIISDYLHTPEEQAWIEDILRSTGRTVTVLMTAGKHNIWDFAERMNAEGFNMRPQVGARPASILMMLEGTINPLKIYETYREISRLPIDEQVAKLRDPEFRQRMLNETPFEYKNADAKRFTTDYAHMYKLDDALSYEPSSAQDSVAGIAEREGRKPLEVMMDIMADRIPLLFFFGRYEDNLEGQKAVMEHKHSVFGLSDGGAHCGVLCDASLPTYMLAYFTRDRQRGDTMPLEFVVHKMTQDTAQVYGLNDRGVIAPGYKADLNLIDYDALKLDAPKMVYDMPGGGKRLIQQAQGYLATVCSGVVTYENGEYTGATPGRLVRGGQ